ncbi:hypothetical protein HY990_04440 [Candidatus Micrarchaeota archaeon]|nr:hypothetical protein [Candidatus Micrarchaeota archaeon]
MHNVEHNLNCLIFAEGNGYGHVARDRLLSEHFQIPIMTFGKGAEYCRLNNVPLIEIPSPYKLRTGTSKVKLATDLGDILKILTPEALAVINSEFKKVDCVIVDGSPLGVILSGLMGKPSVYISNDTSAFVGVDGAIQKRVASSMLRNLLKSSQSVIVPDLPPPFTVTALNLDSRLPMRFCGPLISHLPQVRHNKKYVVSGRLQKSLYPLLGDDAIFGSNYEDLRKYYADCQAVICHGGHTTIMEALSYGKPVICVVEHAYVERMNNARILEQKNIGILLEDNERLSDSLSFALDYLPSLNSDRLRLYQKASAKLDPISFFTNVLSGL